VQHLLEYAPENFHVCLIARQRPALSLAKLRVGDEIGEIDVADLRFSEAETAKYVESRIGPLGPAEMRKLYELTDGWVAALLLVELALGKHPQISEFLRLRPASLRSFNELLDSEVLDKLPRDVFQLLVSAAACRRINGPLCRSLSGTERAGEILAELYERNLFLTEVGSDDHLTWYRLHPLLRQRLLEHFLNLDEAARTAVNRSACDWFSEHGYNDDAVRHAIHAADVDRAADLIESCARELIFSGMFRRLIDWAGSLPSEHTARRLNLQLSLGWAQVFNSPTDVMLDTCRRIEALTEEGDRHSQYELLLLRGAIALLKDDSEAAWASTRDDSKVPASAGTMLTGIRANILNWSLAFRGDHDGARTAYLSARFSPSEEVAPSRRIIGESFHGMSLLLQGEFVLAERVLRDAFTMGINLAGPHSETACIAAGFLGEALYELGQIDEIIKLVGERADLIERLAPLDIPLRGLTSLARAHRVRGSRDEAASILAHLEEIAVLNRHDRTLACVLGEQVTWFVADGNKDGARDAMRRLERLATSHPLEPLNATSEIPLLASLKRVETDLAEANPRQALEGADVLVAKCTAWRRHQLVVRLKLLVVRAQLSLRNVEAALAALRDALHVGRRRGMVRTYLDSGVQVRDLMRSMLASGSEEPELLDYLAWLLAREDKASVAPAKGAARKASTAPPVGITERELEIVGMLARVLTNKKIARALGISDGTVKWHMKNIYGKLGVTSRDEALARCRDLGLLG
ncbi:MAG: LuxR C-terminal-related transcriptional regulator, partial [Burkholderiaceae bacterium]